MKSSIASLVSLAFCLSTQADPCPSEYQQAPNEGDCFKVFKTVKMLPWPMSVDEAEAACGHGGLLASIHSEEENEFARSMLCDPGYPEPFDVKIFGLKCSHTGCSWDDGTPVDYNQFENKFHGTGCFVINNSNGKWHPSMSNCSSQKGCAVCRVKAQTLDCAEGEIPYKGGCVSVHSERNDQQTAESVCPNGGHLASIHSAEENKFYQTLASSAELALPFYVGGRFSGSDFNWIDETFPNYRNFAHSFPNMLLGDCVQVMLSTEFGTLGQWTNVDCSTRLPYLCFRDGRQLLTTTTKRLFTTTTKPQPLANATCPPLQYFNVKGKVYSPNYPFSIPSSQKCEYVLTTDRDTKAYVKFPSYDCSTGTKLSLFDGLDSTEAIVTFTSTAPSPSRVYSATSNVIKIVFEASTATTGAGWEAEFFGLKN